MYESDSAVYFEGCEPYICGYSDIELLEKLPRLAMRAASADDIVNPLEKLEIFLTELEQIPTKYLSTHKKFVEFAHMVGEHVRNPNSVNFILDMGEEWSPQQKLNTV